MPPPVAEVSAPAFTFVSTFAGCGGSSLGYTLAGGKCLLAVEWDDHAVAVYRANFPGTPIYHGDICALTGAAVLTQIGLKPGELDVFDGSPPCQGFSTIGSRDLDDKRNQLFLEYVRLLRALQPRVFVMENVSGMVKGAMRLIFAECMRELKSSGYRVSCRLLNAQWFGVPQSRERVIFIGTREDLGIQPSHPRAQKRLIPLRAVIGDAEAFREGFGPTKFDGVMNKKFSNSHWRSISQPSCTITRTRPPIVRLADGRQREMTPAECARVGSFPDTFRWLGSKAQIINRIGNSVPPMLAKAIGEHMRDVLLKRRAAA